MGGFFSSLFTGKDPTLDTNINNFQTQAGFASGVGEGDVTAASKWYNDILSGDPTKQAEAIAPETSAIQSEGQQAKDTTAQFSPRSGGTASWMAGLDENSRAQIIKLLGGLQSGAAASDATLGENEQGLALTDQQAADQAAQQRQQNWANSIVGHGIISGVQSLEELGEQYIAGPGQTSAADSYGAGGAV
jgi:hypothetical protein